MMRVGAAMPLRPDVRRAIEIAANLDGIDRDDRRGAGDTSTLHGTEAERTAADDSDGRSRLDRGQRGRPGADSFGAAQESVGSHRWKIGR